MIAPWHKPPFNGDKAKYDAHMDATKHRWTETDVIEMGEELHQMMVDIYDKRERRKRGEYVPPPPPTATPPPGTVGSPFPKDYDPLIE